MELWEMLLGSGVVLVAIITLIKEVILWNKNRNAQREDRAEELEESRKSQNYDELKKIVEDGFFAINEKIGKGNQEVNIKIDAISAKQDDQCLALRESLHNSIVHISEKYITAGEIPVGEYTQLKRLADAHHAIGGNGATHDLMETLHSIIK